MALENVPDRLPPLSAALALESIGLEVQRDQFGMKWCAAHGIGARRKKLGRALTCFAPMVLPIRTVTTEAALLEAGAIARDQTRVFLSEMCRICKHEKCPLKSW